MYVYCSFSKNDSRRSLKDAEWDESSWALGVVAQETAPTLSFVTGHHSNYIYSGESIALSWFWRTGLQQYTYFFFLLLVLILGFVPIFQICLST